MPPGFLSFPDLLPCRSSRLMCCFFLSLLLSSVLLSLLPLSCSAVEFSMPSAYSPSLLDFFLICVHIHRLSWTRATTRSGMASTFFFIFFALSLWFFAYLSLRLPLTAHAQKTRCA